MKALDAGVSTGERDNEKISSSSGSILISTSLSTHPLEYSNMLKTIIKRELWHIPSSKLKLMDR